MQFTVTPVQMGIRHLTVEAPGGRRVRLTQINALLDDLPLVLVDGGRLLTDRMRMSHTTVDDILEEGRRTTGIERLDRIRSAVLERSGGISVIRR